MFALSSPPEKFVSLEEKLITPLVLVDTRWIFIAKREQYNSLNKCTHTHTKHFITTFYDRGGKRLSLAIFLFSTSVYKIYII